MATYNGWTNYETWAVKLWMDSEERWRDETYFVWNNTADKSPYPYMSHKDNALHELSETLKNEYDNQSDHPVFKAAEGTVYADLLNAALSEVNWHEIAEALMEDCPIEDEDKEIA